MVGNKKIIYSGLAATLAFAALFIMSACEKTDKIAAEINNGYTFKLKFMDEVSNRKGIIF